jgi:hypothetical protein
LSPLSFLECSELPLCMEGGVTRAIQSGDKSPHSKGRTTATGGKVYYLLDRLITTFGFSLIAVVGWDALTIWLTTVN